ncbi:uncharacterized protein [Narcine bancroftii]|uniref:uncharacterized protein n=1 Tax=Narcine bancroftii TaxID=1343680 RepID=UPI00383210CF
MVLAAPIPSSDGAFGGSPMWQANRPQQLRLSAHTLELSVWGKITEREWTSAECSRTSKDLLRARVRMNESVDWLHVSRSGQRNAIAVPRNLGSHPVLRTFSRKVAAITRGRLHKVKVRKLSETSGIEGGIDRSKSSVLYLNKEDYNRMRAKLVNMDWELRKRVAQVNIAPMEDENEKLILSNEEIAEASNMLKSGDRDVKGGVGLDKIILTKEIVMRKLIGLRVIKSPGPDGMHPSVLKEMAVVMDSLESGQVLEIWKTANITPLFKMGCWQKTANLAAIAILLRGKCGLSKCITYYLVAMAVTDLVVTITAVIFNRTVNIYFPLSVLSITPVCKLIFVLIYASRDCSVWVTVVFTFDRHIAICCQKLKTTYCTERTAIAAIGIVCAVNCVMNVPWYFTYKPAFVVNGVPWLCEGALAFDIYPAWAAYDWIHRILTPCLPFFLILLLNVLTVRHILAANRTRRRLLNNRNGDNHSDPETECRRKSIVLLLLISCCFILSWILIFIKIIYVRIVKMPYFSGSNFKDPVFILEESGYMLQLLSSCINPFIYVGTQKKIRDQLNSGLKYPLTLFVRLFK